MASELDKKVQIALRALFRSVTMAKGNAVENRSISLSYTRILASIRAAF